MTLSKKVNNSTVPKDSILVTMDVKSLYHYFTSIPNHEGIAAVKKT